jgi:hypothetical protein
MVHHKVLPLNRTIANSRFASIALGSYYLSNLMKGEDKMRKRIVLTLLALCITLSLAAHQKPPVFYFGGQRLFAGMPKSEAVALLAACCKLYPPADSKNENMSVDRSGLLGHRILAKEESPHAFLGTIFFVGEKVARIDRPLDETFDSGSDDVVAFARALDRSLSQDTGDSSATVFASTQHQRITGAEVEVLSLEFPNGRTVELQIFTLDTPSKVTGKRDAVSLDEALVAPRQ